MTPFYWVALVCGLIATILAAQTRAQDEPYLDEAGRG